MRCRLIIITCSLFVFPRSFSSAQKNICIDSTNRPEEVSIAYCPSDISKLLVGANIINYYYSDDTGRTWKNGIMRSRYGVWGDPTLVSDNACNFYYFHLSTPPQSDSTIKGHWLDRLVCQKSADDGKTWSDSSYIGLNGLRNQDKPGVAVDLTNSPFSNRIYISWTQFDTYGSYKTTDSSRILFSYSADGGLSWKKPVRIDHHAGDCHDNDSTVEGAVPCVGPNGEVYDAWSGPGGIVFNKSSDGGNTWLPKTIPVTEQIGGWCYNISGIDRCDGLPVTLCDISHSPYRGTIYINFSDQQDGSDNTNIWLTRSNDGGNSWSNPMQVNSSTGGQHFMSWMTIDQTTGFLYCIYYDRSEQSGDTTNVYMAVSEDGGITFTNFRINETSFLPNSIVFFGDYIDIIADNNVVRPVWMQLNKYRLSIWTDLINPGGLGWDLGLSGQSSVVSGQLDIGTEEAGNNNSVWLTFRLPYDELVSLSVVNVLGREVRKILNDKFMEKGDGEYILNEKKEKLKPGVYAYKLKTKEGVRYKRFVIY